MPPEIIDCWIETPDGSRAKNVALKPGEEAEGHVVVENTDDSNIYEVGVVGTIGGVEFARREGRVLAPGEGVEVVGKIPASAVGRDPVGVDWAVNGEDYNL